MDDNPLSDIKNYNAKMTISQVVKFFQKKNCYFTKTMIQNYLRVGVLFAPIDNRYYNQSHLIVLVFVETFKDVFSLAEIKSFLKQFEQSNFETNEMIKLYDNLTILKRDVFFSMQNLESSEVETNELLTFMVHAKVAKELATKLL